MRETVSEAKNRRPTCLLDASLKGNLAAGEASSHRASPCFSNTQLARPRTCAETAQSTKAQPVRTRVELRNRKLATPGLPKSGRPWPARLTSVSPWGSTGKRTHE